MSDNIYQKISKVMADVRYLCKDDKVQAGQGSYKAISEEKVTSTVRESLIKHGIVIIPVEQEHTRTDETLTDKYGNEKTNRMSTVDVKYRIQNIEDKDDYIIATSSGTGVDTQDKGVGKAMTYSYKYLLLRVFAIPTGEDPDKISSQNYDEQFKEVKVKISGEQESALRYEITAKKVPSDKVVVVLSNYGYKTLKDIEENKYEEVYGKIFG